MVGCKYRQYRLPYLRLRYLSPLEPLPRPLIHIHKASFLLLTHIFSILWLIRCLKIVSYLMNILGNKFIFLIIFCLLMSITTDVTGPEGWFWTNYVQTPTCLNIFVLLVGVGDAGLVDRLTRSRDFRQEKWFFSFSDPSSGLTIFITITTSKGCRMSKNYKLCVKIEWSAYLRPFRRSS